MLKERADKLEEDGEDEYEVRQQVSPVFSFSELARADLGPVQQRRVHADSLQMIPDSEKRLAKAVGELEDLVVSSP